MDVTNVIGDYELGRFIGNGVYGKVYLARDPKRNKTLAIKSLPKAKIGDTIPKNIEKEIRAMQWLVHPNIVRLHDTVSTDKRVYLVMEYVPGGTLSDLLFMKGGKLEEKDARLYFQQLISAVEYCHKKGVFHRDLKTDNLLIDGNGNLKVSDFGLCALQTEEELEKHILQKTMCGTLAYAAPEMLSNNGYEGAKADLWSCGIILYVLLTGIFPFSNPNRPQLLKQIVAADFVCPDWISEEVRVILRRLLEPNPKKRMTSEGLMEFAWFREGLELSKRVESYGDDEYLFGSNLSPCKVVKRIENIGEDGGFCVTKSSHNMSVSMEREEVKGRRVGLSVIVKVFYNDVRLIGWKVILMSGDGEEFKKFVEEELKPNIQDITTL